MDAKLQEIYHRLKPHGPGKKRTQSLSLEIGLNYL